MLRPLRHHWHQILRTGLLLVLALSLAAQPVLGALGEVHELTVHTDASRGHMEHNVSHEHASTTPADEGDGDPMHELLHYGHCCGHTVGLTGTNLPLPGIVWSAAHPGNAMMRPVVASPATTPFRPPIPA